ncbi:hypothetical protein BDV06DRAFT_36204 [Aspergillus oleicola]
MWWWWCDFYQVKEMPEWNSRVSLGSAGFDGCQSTHGNIKNNKICRKDWREEREKRPLWRRKPEERIDECMRRKEFLLGGTGSVYFHSLTQRQHIRVKDSTSSNHAHCSASGIVADCPTVQPCAILRRS